LQALAQDTCSKLHIAFQDEHSQGALGAAVLALWRKWKLACGCARPPCNSRGFLHGGVIAAPTDNAMVDLVCHLPPGSEGCSGGLHG
jgi:hypothetical protein